MIRPYLKKKYANLCNINTPITSFLFGDDVQREIKKCDTSLSVTREQYNFYGPQRMRLRGKAEACPDICSQAMVVHILVGVMVVINHMEGHLYHMASIDIRHNTRFQKSPKRQPLSPVWRTWHHK